MKFDNTAVFILVLATLAAFAGGYWLGNHNTLQHLASSSELTDNEPPALSNAQASTTKRANILELSNSQATNIVVDEQTAAPTVKIADETNSTLNPTAPLLASNASVIDTIAFLNALESSENNYGYSEFGPAIDALRDLVKDNPENFQIVADYFADSNIESQVPYYLTAVLNRADIADKDILMNNLALRLSAQGTPSGNTRLLHLVSSTGLHHQNEEVITTIKNIALYSQAESINRTYALDLLMPFQLNSNEKNKVLSDLSFALHQASGEEVSYIVENIIRFSDKNEKVELAKSYLADTNSFETRVAILTTMHNRSIEANDALKEALFNIAQNTNDPLSTHARDTLMYVFEIDNNEYNRLRNGG